MARKTPLDQKIRKPVFRRLRGYAFDPSLATVLETSSINEVILKLPWEELEPGPVDEFLEVIDVDPASGTAYEPVDLNQPWVLAQDGLAPSESNPQFHQQYVYAVARTTIEHFNIALGRKSLWSPRWLGKGERFGRSKKAMNSRSSGASQWEYTERLRIYPHALRVANAYYSPIKKALLFGYFSAEPQIEGAILPGGTIFTCLSHDIIVHETTHALLDGLHLYYMESSNPDVPAFHEAFSDLVALFQHFSYPEVIHHQIAKTKGRLENQNLLAELARQMGQGLGQYGALREYIGSRVNGVWKPKRPDPTLIQRTRDPYERGAILVSAVFNAFLSIYRRRTADLLRIASGGTGVLPQGQLHPDLIGRMVQEVTKSARHFLTMCIRALDYCPPVDITFGEYLRALITADYDLVPNDPYGYRVALIEAFGSWGIYPDGVRSLSQDSLLWNSPSKKDNRQLNRVVQGVHIKLKEFFDLWHQKADRRKVYETSKSLAKDLEDELTRHSDVAWERFLGVDLSRFPPRRFPLHVHSIRPARRLGPNGQFIEELIIDITQERKLFTKRQAPLGLNSWNSNFRGGCTLIYDPNAETTRYAIRKEIGNQQRFERQQEYVRESLGATWQGLWNSHSHMGEPLAMLHGMAGGGWT